MISDQSRRLSRSNDHPREGSMRRHRVGCFKKLCRSRFSGHPRITAREAVSVPVSFTSRLLRSTGWNLLGESLPILAALVSIPVLVHRLGVERFGALTLIWALVGYLGMLDAGLGRALIHELATLLEARRRTEAAAIVRLPVLTMLGLGLVGAFGVMAAAEPMTTGMLHVAPALQGDVARSMMIAAWLVPIGTAGSGLRGVLEAHHRFDLVNLVRIPVGVLNYCGPLVILPFTNRLDAVVAAITLGRLMGLVGFGLLANQLLPGSWRGGAAGGIRPLRGLLTMGGWMTVSNVISPLMLYADRFALGTLMSVGVVAYYTTPYDLLMRLLLIPTALSGVLFPTTAQLVIGDRRRLASLLDVAGHLVLGAFLPALALTLLFGRAALGLWLGDDFALHSYGLLSILMLGVLLNALAHLPFAMIQGVGRADVTARLHLIELPCYLGVLWLLVSHYGLTGAAVAWSLRAGVDAILLFCLMPRMIGGGTDQVIRRISRRIGVTGLVAVVAAAVSMAPFLSGTAAAVLAAAAGIGAAMISTATHLIRLLHDGRHLLRGRPIQL